MMGVAVVGGAMPRWAVPAGLRVAGSPPPPRVAAAAAVGPAEQGAGGAGAPVGSPERRRAARGRGRRERPGPPVDGSGSFPAPAAIVPLSRRDPLLRLRLCSSGHGRAAAAVMPRLQQTLRVQGAGWGLKPHVTEIKVSAELTCEYAIL